MEKVHHLTDELRRYFDGRDDVAMAFLFGSQATGQSGAESDTDVAVYFWPRVKRDLEWEEDKSYPAHDDIWSAVERISPTPVTDVVVLNRATAIVAANIVENGVPLVIKDRDLLWRFWLAVTDAAEEFRQIKEDWRATRKRSRSLSDYDRERLRDRLEFMETELSDLEKFSDLTYQQYLADRDRRRNVERWVENIVNASIDIAKTLLASERRETPMRYADVLLALGGLPHFQVAAAKQMALFAKTRNWLAHEYLDMSFDRIRQFVTIAGDTYPHLIDFARKKSEDTQGATQEGTK